MKKLLLATAVALAAVLPVAPAHAGSYECQGKIHPTTTWIIVTPVDEHEAGCRFKNNSSVGRKVLHACPDGSHCCIELDIDNPRLKKMAANSDVKDWGVITSAATNKGALICE